MFSGLDWIRDVNRQIRAKIQKYADDNNLTFNAAAQRAYLTVNGVKIEPFRVEDLDVNIEATKEEGAL